MAKERRESSVDALPCPVQVSADMIDSQLTALVLLHDCRALSDSGNCGCKMP
jgi:hypothetical protein